MAINAEIHLFSCILCTRNCFSEYFKGTPFQDLFIFSFYPDRRFVTGWLGEQLGFFSLFLTLTLANQFNYDLLDCGVIKSRPVTDNCALLLAKITLVFWFWFPLIWIDLDLVGIFWSVNWMFKLISRLNHQVRAEVYLCLLHMYQQYFNNFLILSKTWRLN